MNLTPAIRAKIDAMSYDQLVRRWRFSGAGDPMFQGEAGNYWARRMIEVEASAGGGRSAASKRIGWVR